MGRGWPSRAAASVDCATPGARDPRTGAGRHWARQRSAARALPAAMGLTQHRAGRGEALVLLHGLGLTWLCWKPVLPALEAVHDVVALDLPGFGASPALDDGRRPTVGALADAVEAELDRLGLDAPHLAGNSLGGWIALELARRGRARTVVALAPAGLELPPERAYVISLNEAMRARAKAGALAPGVLTGNPLGRVAMLG